MNKLDKSRLSRRSEIAAELREKGEALVNAVDAFNEAMGKAAESVKTALDDYNAVVRKAGEFRDEVVSEMEQHYEDRSDKWQEGERGTAYGDWKSNWEEMAIEDLEVELPDDVDQPDLELADEFEGLADSPEGG
jgi:DNA anti-recombination protein RmuC